MIESRLVELNEISLKNGEHAPGKEMCALEAVAYIAGESWSDHPECACPVIASFMRSWNDALPSDAERDRLLKPLIPRLVGSRSTGGVESRRAWMALDWLVRVQAPAWLHLAGLAEQADLLRDLAEFTSADTCRAGQTKRDAAWAAAEAAAGAAAWDAAGAAARDAARAAARAAAGAAAWAAAWDAAGAAAGAAAWAAAWDAAGAAAGAAAWDAAGAAARDRLALTVAELQLSAVALIERMLEVQP